MAKRPSRPNRSRKTHASAVDLRRLLEPGVSLKDIGIDKSKLRLPPALLAHKRRTEKFLAGLESIGTTDPDDVLAHAVKIAPEFLGADFVVKKTPLGFVFRERIKPKDKTLLFTTGLSVTFGSLDLHWDSDA